jgi:uncharacterized damage-inducible protein DinB
MYIFDYVNLVEFNNWANERVLTASAKLSESQLYDRAALRQGSVFETLCRMLQTENNWRLSCQGHQQGKFSFGLKPIETLEALSAAWQNESQLLLRYVHIQKPENFEQQPMMQEGYYPAKVGHILVHLVLSSSGIRGGLSGYFQQCGVAAASLEYLDYLSSRD